MPVLVDAFNVGNFNWIFFSNKSGAVKWTACTLQIEGEYMMGQLDLFTAAVLWSHLVGYHWIGIVPLSSLSRSESPGVIKSVKFLSIKIEASQA